MASIDSLIRTFQAIGPLAQRAIVTGQLFHPQCELVPPDPDVLCEYDVAVPLPEGYSLEATIFKSRRAEAAGEPVPFRGSVGNAADMVSRGFCRVSRRELDTAASTPWQPVLTGRSRQPLAPGERVAVEIELYPASTFFATGESLRLIVASDEIIPSPPYRKRVDCNHGRHVLHYGGEYDSHLLVPVIPGAGTHAGGAIA